VFRKKKEGTRLRHTPKKPRGAKRILDTDIYKITVLLPRLMFEKV